MRSSTDQAKRKNSTNFVVLGTWFPCLEFILCSCFGDHKTPAQDHRCGWSGFKCWQCPMLLLPLYHTAKTAECLYSAASYFSSQSVVVIGKFFLPSLSVVSCFHRESIHCDIFMLFKTGWLLEMFVFLFNFFFLIFILLQGVSFFTTLCLSPSFLVHCMQLEFILHSGLKF